MRCIRSVSLVVLGVSVVAGGLLVGCSGAPEDPGAFAPAEAQGPLSSDPELAELEIGADELVADEAAGDAELEAHAWPEASEADEEGTLADDLLDVALLDTAEIGADIADELPEPPAGLGEETGPAFSSVGLLSDPVIGAARAWWTKSYTCARNPLGSKCECRGSLYNCQFPNNQPGRNRYLPPAAIRALRTVTGKKTRSAIIENVGRWGIENGTIMYDGAGHARGTVSGGCYDFTGGKIVRDDRNHPCVRINFGQLKKMKVDGSNDTKQYVYAFSTGITTKTGRGAASGWILAANVIEGAFKRYDTPPRSGGSATFAKTDYVLKAATDYPGCNLANYDSTRCLPDWAQLKVRPRSGPNVSEKARDYMLRDGNVVNLAYQTPLLGGAATDTFVALPDALGFERVRSTDSDRRTILRISLFKTKDADAAGTTPVRTMTFVYGRVEGRYGWVASAALKKGKKRAVDASCFGQRDGRVCNSAATGAVTCQAQLVVARQDCPGSQRCDRIEADAAQTLICR